MLTCFQPEIDRSTIESRERGRNVTVVGGPTASVCESLMAMQSRDAHAVWRTVGSFMDVEWSGVDHLVVSAFYTAVQAEWPNGPSGPHVKAFVRFLWERYDEVIAIPEYVTEALIMSVFTGDYRVFSFVPRDTMLTLQLLVTAAITAHRSIRGERLMQFVDNVARDVETFRQVSR